MKRKQQIGLRKQAFGFVVTIGIVNLFGDVTYEGARSITGPFLESLGASALAVAVIAGGGELFGYALRFIAGYFADKSIAFSSEFCAPIPIPQSTTPMRTSQNNGMQLLTNVSHNHIAIPERP